MDQQKIGAFLKELRRERGLTQEDLAEEVWVARRTVSRWETGRSLPDLDLLPRLADLYQVDLRELLDGQRQAAAPAGDMVARVAEYGAAEKRQTVRLARAYFVAGAVALTVNGVLGLLEVGGTFLAGFAKGCTFGLALAAMVVGILFTTGTLDRLRAAKLRLLRGQKGGEPQ